MGIAEHQWQWSCAEVGIGGDMKRFTNVWLMSAGVSRGKFFIGDGQIVPQYSS